MAGDEIARETALRRRRVLGWSLVLIASITALRFAADEAEAPITVLYVIPIAVVAAEFGIKAAVAVALLCFGLYESAVWLVDVPATLLGDLIRLAVFLSVAVFVGWVGLKLRSALDDLERSSVVMRTIGEATPDVIYAKDPEGRYTLINSTGSAFVHRTPEEMVGKTDHDLLTEEDARQSEALDRRALEESEVIEIKRTVSLDGEQVHFRGYTGRLETYSGETIGVFGVARDVTTLVLTERVRATYLDATRVIAEMPEPEELGNRLLDVLVDGEVIPRGRVLDEAESAPEAGDDEFAVLPMVAAGEDFGSLVLELGRHRDGGDSARAMITGVGALAEQYLERRVAEREAERLKNEFFGLVSHELRSPLTSILGYTELLEEIEAERLSDQGRGFIGVIDRNARRQLRLVQDLLLLVRVEGGRFTLDLSEGDLRSVVAEACEAVGPQAAAKEVELDLELADVGAADFDAVRFGQAVDNLLTNAIKFSPDGGRVAVSLTGEDGVATVTVADSGIGVAADEVDKLFDRLFRASSAIEQQIQGTGLGLTIVKAVTEAHGGRVSVESELGRGTTFKLELPVLVDEDGRGDPRPANLEGQLR